MSKTFRDYKDKELLLNPYAKVEGLNEVSVRNQKRMYMI